MEVVIQVFVPESSFAACAAVLDRQRLGKQRVEVLQILKALSGETRGWVNHPATRMWAANPAGLSAYGVAVCDEWVGRGYKDTCRDKIAALCAPDPADLPAWWGRLDVMESHRSNLIRKFPEHYGAFWDTPDDLPYIWVDTLVSA